MLMFHAAFAKALAALTLFLGCVRGRHSTTLCSAAVVCLNEKQSMRTHQCSNATMSSKRKAVAKSAAVLPYWLLISLRAPSNNSSLTSSTCPLIAAIISAVWPLLSTAFTLAP